MNLVSEYTVNDFFCVFVGITFRKFSLYFSLSQDDVIASILYPCMLSNGILNLPIYGRQKQLKPCFVLKCVDLSTYKRIICIFQMAFSHPMVIIVCNGRGAYFSLLRQTSSYFQQCEIFYLALVQDKTITCVLPANACCTVYVNCPPNSPCFSFLK